MTYVPPEVVECRCGGAAIKYGGETIEQSPRGMSTYTVTHYRHAGVNCPVGGAIIAKNGRFHHCVGPLFRRWRSRIPGLSDERVAEVLASD